MAYKFQSGLARLGGTVAIDNSNEKFQLSGSIELQDKSLAIAELDINGGGAIGQAAADGDLLVIANASDSNNVKKITMAALGAYFTGSGEASEVGFAAVNNALQGASGSVRIVGHSISGSSALEIVGQSFLQGNVNLSGNIVAPGTLTIDAATDIKLDADGGDVFFLDGGTEIGKISNSSNDLVISSSQSDKDIIFKGNDGASAITALTLDMSDAGRATFNDDVRVGANAEVLGDLIIGAGANEFTIAESSDNITMTVGVQDKDLTIVGDDGGSSINMLAFDTSDAGKATFNGVVVADAGFKADNITIDGTEIDLSSGDLTLDVAGDIILDADGADVRLSDGGTEFGKFTKSSSNLIISASLADGDIIFNGNDATSAITALTLDMGSAGAATFNNKIVAGAGLEIANGGTIGAGNDADMLTFAQGLTITVADDVTLAFTDTGETIHRSVDGFLDITAGTGINLSGAVSTTSTLTVNNAAVIGGNITGGGTLVASGKITGDEYATDGDEFTVSTAGAIAASSLALAHGFSAGAVATTSSLQVGYSGSAAFIGSLQTPQETVSIGGGVQASNTGSLVTGSVSAVGYPSFLSISTTGSEDVKLFLPMSGTAGLGVADQGKVLTIKFDTVGNGILVLTGAGGASTAYFDDNQTALSMSSPQGALSLIWTGQFYQVF